MKIINKRKDTYIFEVTINYAYDGYEEINEALICVNNLIKQNYDLTSVGGGTACIKFVFEKETQVTNTVADK